MQDLTPAIPVRWEEFPGYARDLSAIFVPYLTPIIGFWFVKRATTTKPQETGAFLVAAAISVVFCGIVLALVVSIPFQEAGQGVTKRTLEVAKSLAVFLAFAVGPAVGYYFGKVR